MSVEINTERKLVQISFGPSEEEVQIFAVGEAGDVHNTAFVDGGQGLAILSYPHDFSGSSSIEVRSASGEVLDSGDIDV